MIGRTLGHYCIVERLGAGGMGEVYRAHDQKLMRDVALKLLPAGALGDEEARRRFRKEGQVLSRLTHPHLAALLDADSAEGIDFLVMELVPGRTLAERLLRGPIEEKEVLRLGAQLARGLMAAHERGIVHRDLKPSNLGSTADGLLKVLDFGVAALERSAAESKDQTATATAPGAVVGTPPYMSPEQLLGRGVDARSDLYSAGAVLYELVTGARPFGAKHGIELHDAVLHDAPASPREVNAAVTSGLEVVILKALDKDPALRYQTARELLVDLERLQQGNPSSVARAPSRRGGAWTWKLAAAGLVVILPLAGLVVLRPSPRITGVRVLAADLKTSSGFDLGSGSWASDGENVYYVAVTGDRTDLVSVFRIPVTGGNSVRQLPLQDFWQLTIHAYVPSERALLISGRVDRGLDTPDGLPLWLVPVPFGTPRRIPNLRAWGADLGPDGRTLALTDIVGSAPTPLRWRLVLAGLDGSWQRVVGQLPPGISRVRWTGDGRRLRFFEDGLGAVSWAQMWEMPIEGGPHRPLGPGIGGRWTNDGRYFLFERHGGGKDQSDIFVRDESHWLPRLGGATQRLTVGPLSFRHAGPAPDGRHLFAYGQMARGELMGLDPVTNAWAPLLGGESAIYAEPSRDGQWLAWVRYPDGTLWKSRPDGSERLQLTSPPLEGHLPRWSPDGTRVAFAGRSPEGPQLSVYVVAADGSSMDVVARPQGRDEYWDPCWMSDDTLMVGLKNSGGLIEVDARGGAARPVPGTDRLGWIKCSQQGDLMATDFGDRAGERFKVRRARATTWEDYGPAGIVYPNWTRDGRAFCGYQILPEPRLVCVSLASRQRTSIAENPPFPLRGWLGAAWMGLDAEDRPMVTADRSTLGFYVLDWEAP